MPFRFTKLSVPEVILVECQVFGDERGVFMETYKASAFAEAGITVTFAQDNYARSQRGVLRGLHYQKSAAAQGKLIRVVSGEIFDVAVDIRRHSPTFRQWAGVRLSARNGQMLYVPPGFAHGYCVLSEVAEVTYKVTAEYEPSLERGVIWNDPDLAIDWPVDRPLLSARDGALPPLRAADNDF
jgi:dTDP-4-dehydrorhamnose 3,5-epimerase